MWPRSLDVLSRRCEVDTLHLQYASRRDIEHGLKPLSFFVVVIGAGSAIVAAVHPADTGSGSGVSGHSSAASGVHGVSMTGSGVLRSSNKGSDVTGASIFGSGLTGTDGNGVTGTGTLEYGVSVISTAAFGVDALSVESVAVYGASGNRYREARASGAGQCA